MNKGRKYIFDFFVGVLLGFIFWTIVIFIIAFIIYCRKNGIPMFG